MNAIPHTIISRQGVEQNRRQFKEQPFGEDLGNDITLEMVAIPGGTFLMGSSPNEKYSFDDEHPQHQVSVPPFFMGKYPITQAQWRAVASRTDLKVKQNLDLNPAYFKDRPDSDRRPVEQVNWYDAVEFCARLSILTGREYRLPSEAEWEYACRAGTTTPFYFGETITGELANYDASETTPVGQFTPNAFGLYDMHGNVWEWCADTWHDNYDGAPSDGSVWLDNNQEENIDGKSRFGTYSVMRGGSWVNNPNLCRSAIRYDSTFRRAYRYYDNGFRVVCVDLDREGADSPRFWDKADRLMMVTVGGAALGGSIAGVYGAVIGAILAAGCGWYITFRKAK
jgi:formylglycine-generating enzyme required for sulfatase activity